LTDKGTGDTMANTIKVKNYMTTNVITIHPGQTIEEIVKIMRDTNHDGFPVVRDEKLVGIITTRDLVLQKRGRKVKDMMVKEVLVTFPEIHLTDAARVMFRKGYSKLPVVDEDKRLIGIITNTDIIRSHIERVTPDKVVKLTQSLEKLHAVKTIVRLGRVKISRLLPTQNRVLPDEFHGREYEIKRGLAEPIIVIKSGERMILVDGHHRALAALKIGIKEIDAYIIVLSRDIELGLEKTARGMGLESVNDIEIVEDVDIGIVDIIKG